MSSGIVLLAHGARDPAWARPIEAIAARLRELQPETPVSVAFLEMMTPDIEAAVGALATSGSRQIRVVPVFLAQAGHVKRDLPARIDALRARLAIEYAGLHIELETAIGEQPEVIEAIAACIGRHNN